MNLGELKKRYVEINKIKKGGQKIVYKVKTGDDATYALKILSDVADPRVQQEIELVGKLSLPNVPRIIETGVVYDENILEEVRYIVEEYIEGISLRDWLARGNRAGLKFAYSILESLLMTEVILENNKILHRDINPNNIMLGTNGVIYLIDFGLAKNLLGPSYTLTAAAHGPFTPGYAPNEQFTNQKMLQDVRTDLFQIGVTIYEICKGANPFVKPDESIMQAVSRTLNDVPPLLRIGGDTKGMFANLVNILMAKNQSQRPDSAKDALRYLYAIKPTLRLEDE